MAIVINGSGTVTGLAVGGLPDGTVDSGTLATDSVVTGKIADGTIANADIADLAASKLTGALPAISGASLTGLTSAQMPAGSVLQVVQGTTSTSVETTSNTFVDTGLTATITPSATTSTILCFVVHAGSRKHTGDTGIEINLLRGSTQVHSTGDHILYTGSTTQLRDNIAFNYQDSPSSSAAIVYKTQFKSTNNTNGVQVQTSSNKSTMILMEVAG